MDYTEIKFDVRDDGIATMTLHRPERLNSFSRKMFDEWKDVVARCAFDEKIRVLIVTGDGPSIGPGGGRARRANLTYIGRHRAR